MSNATPAKLDFTTAIEATPRKKPDQVTQSRAIMESAQSGFAGRADTVKIDRRTIRPRQEPKVQINMKVSAETRTRFIRAARDAADSDAAILNIGQFFETIFNHYEATILRKK